MAIYQYTTERILASNCKLSQFWTSGKYCDVAIEVEGKLFHCHKLVLAMASEYFDAMFGGNFIEANKNHINLNNFDALTIWEILRFIYTGKVTITRENIYRILRAGDFFKVDLIEEVCNDFLEDNIDQFERENLIPVAEIFEMFSFVSYKQNHLIINILSRYIMQHFNQLWGDDNFLELSYDDLNILLSQHWYLPPGNWPCFQNAVKAWIIHGGESRAAQCEELSRKIELQYISTLRMDDNSSVEEDPSYFRILNVPIPGLHMYLDEEDNETRVYSTENKNPVWRKSCVIAESYYSLGCIGFGNELYCLRVFDTHCTFHACSSVDVSQSLDHRPLAAPPSLLEASYFSICSTQKNIYLSNSTRLFSRIQKTDLPSSSNFSAEEIFQGIYSYNTELDKWFPVPLLDHELRETVQRPTVVDNNVLYVVKSVIGPFPNSGRISVLALDDRLSKWQELKGIHEHMNYSNDTEVICCAHEGNIYVSNVKEFPNEVPMLRYDLVANKWENIESIKEYETDYTVLKLLSYGGCVWAFGEDEYSYQNIKIYNPYVENWGPSPIRKDIGNEDVSGHFLDAVIFQPSC